MKKLTTLLIFFLLSAAANADRLDSIYNAIDDAISHAGDYTAQKRQRLEKLRQTASKATGNGARYKATIALYEEYKSYRNDSAIACLNRCIDMAGKMGRTDLKTDCYNRMAQQQLMAGFYNEALNYLQRTPRHELAGSRLAEYYFTMKNLYGEMGAYTQDMNLREEYYRLSARFRDSLMVIIPHDSDYYLSSLETQCSNNHDYRAALGINDRRMKRVTPDSHEFAIVSYFRAMEYGELGNREEQKYWLALSALCDIKNCVMDQASLWSLADILNQEGDIERSHSYVEYSWACTSHFSAHIRSWLVSPVLTMINDKYKEKIRKTNTHLWIMIAIVSLLALLMAGLYIYVSNKRKQLAMARNSLKESNDQLTLSNRVKEEYIGKFFTLCSEYIDKMDNFRIKVNRKMKAKQMDDLMRMSQNDKMKEDELAVLFANFDSIFLHIFPNFLSDLDALLKPEHRTHRANGSKLTTDARIFALIRLGIEDSSKIAEFLHYTPNTIYNYRSRMKSKAINPNCFESDIKRIESKSV